MITSRLENKYQWPSKDARLFIASKDPMNEYTTNLQSLHETLLSHRRRVEFQLRAFLISCNSDRSMDWIMEHDCQELWEEFRDTLEIIDNEIDQETIQAVENIIVELASFEFKSLAFRSSKTSKFITTIPDSLIDFRNLEDVISGVRNFFDSVHVFLKLKTSPQEF